MTIYIAGLESEHSAPIVIETKTLTMGAVDASEGIVAPEAGEHTYLKDIDAQIIAMPASGYLFAGWTGDAVDDPYNIITTVKMDDDKSVQASFALKRTLTILATGGGTTSPAPGIYEKKDGEKIHISALANDGYEFKEWLGGSTSVKPDISVTMNADITVLAYFVEKETPVESDIILYASTDADDEGIDYNNGTEWVPVATMNHNRLSNLGEDTHPHYLTEGRHDALTHYIAQVDALPAATEDLRGLELLLRGGTGVADTINVCIKNAADTYEWTLL